MLPAKERERSEVSRQQELNLQWTLLWISISAAAIVGLIEVIFEAHWRRMDGKPVLRGHRMGRSTPQPITDSGKDKETISPEKKQLGGKPTRQKKQKNEIN